MHNASSANYEVVRHYEKGGLDRPSRSPTTTLPVQSSEQERRDLVAFLETLTGAPGETTPCPRLPGIQSQ